MKYPLDSIGHFRTARILSYTADNRPGHRLGAVLHRGNRALSFGINSLVKTHPIQYHVTGKIYLHAEIAALIGRRHYDDLSSCSITVYREVKGLPALAKPCAQCQIILAAAGIKKVYYSVPDAPYWNIIKL